jgi:hypothetical protein
MISNVRTLPLALALLALTACATNRAPTPQAQINSHDALDYLRSLEGTWVVDGGNEGTFGWEFDLTARQNVVLERLKVGTPAEMTTVYNLDNGKLVGAHFCQLQNQPNLIATSSTDDDDLYFLCDGNVGNTDSHNELHMHGVHFKKNARNVRIWMDMFENNELAFQTSYTLVRAAQ